MNGPPPFRKHDIFPNQVYNNIAVPPNCPPERYAALHTEAFTPRPDDIVVSTFAKSGTTWLQNMVYNLVGCPNGPIVRITETVPWLQDSWSVKLEDIEKMKGPRVFKTHDYWSWMPEKLRDTARFIYCSRNPKDQAVSYFHHMKTLEKIYGKICAEMTFNEYFDQIYTKKDVAEFGMWEDHNIEWLEQSARKNILFVTYEDLREDTERELRKMVEFLGLSVDEEIIAETLKQGGFEHMQKSNNLNYSWVTEGSKTGFVRKGQVGGRAEYLSEEQSAYFDGPIKRVIEAGGNVRCNL
ncbi:sulfotransferase 1C2-like [Bolinopsis microptera]|uniref:sulfotransferase 1C2-like n=1 Tax=Bolinopsis microptera TaxID=2820187 RepID=UPI0030791F73